MNKDPIETLMGFIEAGGGWDGLDMDPSALKADFERQNELVEAEARIVADAIETPDGAAFLFWLARRTIFSPPPPVDPKAAADTEALRMARREGRDRVFFMILAALQAAAGAKGGEPIEGE
jgi:hypothetical protein